MEEQRPWNGSPLIISSLRDSYPPICAIQSSGLCEPLGLDHGGAGFLDRAANGQLWESGQLQMDQLQQKIRIPSDMSIESLTKLLLTSGEYLNIHIKAFNYLNNERERSNVITINNKRKRSNVITMVEQATQNRNLRTPYRSGACHNETQSIRGTSTGSTKKNFKISISQGTQRRCLSTLRRTRLQRVPVIS